MATPCLSRAAPWPMAMVPGASAAPPVRIAFVFMPNGVNYEAWAPVGEALAAIPESDSVVRSVAVSPGGDVYVAFATVGVYRLASKSR